MHKYHFVAKAVAPKRVSGNSPYCSLIGLCNLVNEDVEGFFISVNFCFSFVSNSLAYITITKNKPKKTQNKTKLTEMEKKKKAATDIYQQGFEKDVSFTGYCPT